MVNFIPIKSLDEWGTTNQACRNELEIVFPSKYILLCIKYGFTKITFCASLVHA